MYNAICFSVCTSCAEEFTSKQSYIRLCCQCRDVEDEMMDEVQMPEVQSLEVQSLEVQMPEVQELSIESPLAIKLNQLDYEREKMSFEQRNGFCSR